jgi:hypothetical protein
MFQSDFAETPLCFSEALVEADAVLREQVVIAPHLERARQRRRDGDERVGAHFGFVIGVVAADREAVVIRRCPAQRAASACHVGAALRAELAVSPLIRHAHRQPARLRGIDAGKVVNVLIALARLRDTRDAREERIGDGEIVRAAQIEPIEAPVGHGNISRVVARRLLAHVAHGTADGATSEQRALRSAQHFDALEVHEIDHRAHRHGEQHVVEIDAHTRLELRQEVVLTDAADERRHGVAECRLRWTEARIRNGVGDIRRGGESALLQVLRRDCGDRDRRLLQAFLTIASSDDHFLQANGFFRRLLSDCWRRAQQRDDASGGRRRRDTRE